MKKKMLYNQDNTSSHTSAIAIRITIRTSPSDFLLFPRLKVALGWQRFLWNEEAIAFINKYFLETYYLDVLKRWEHCWEKCINLQRNYVKNSNKFEEKYFVSLLDEKLYYLAVWVNQFCSSNCLTKSSKITSIINWSFLQEFI